MGMASLLPGMQYTVERMQRMLDEFRAELAALQVGHHGAKARAGKGAWAGTTTEERSEIAKRRWETRRRNAAAKAGEKIPGLHPRDAQHPGHDAWIAKLKVAHKKAWAALTPAEKQAKSDRMRRVGKLGRQARKAA